MNLTELWPIILQPYKGRGRLFLVSYAFQTLEKCVFFEGLQLTLVPFLKISYDLETQNPSKSLQSM